MHLDPRLVFSLKVNHLLKKVEKRRITQTGLYALWWNVQFNTKKILVVVLPLMTRFSDLNRHISYRPILTTTKKVNQTTTSPNFCN